MERRRVKPSLLSRSSLLTSASPQVLAKRSVDTKAEVSNSRPSVSVIEADFKSVASYRELARVNPRCSGGAPCEESTVSKNFGEISCRRSCVKEMAAVSLSVFFADKPSRLVDWWRGEQSACGPFQRQDISAYLCQIKNPKGNIRSVQPLHLLVVKPERLNNERRKMYSLNIRFERNS